MSVYVTQKHTSMKENGKKKFIKEVQSLFPFHITFFSYTLIYMNMNLWYSAIDREEINRASEIKMGIHLRFCVRLRLT